MKFPFYFLPFFNPSFVELKFPNVQVQMLNMEEAPSTDSGLERLQVQLETTFPLPDQEAEKLHLKENLRTNLREQETRFKQDSDLYNLFRILRD